MCLPDFQDFFGGGYQQIKNRCPGLNLNRFNQKKTTKKIFGFFFFINRLKIKNGFFFFKTNLYKYLQVKAISQKEVHDGLIFGKPKKI